MSKITDNVAAAIAAAAEVLQAKADQEDAAGKPKAGFLTSEFWLAAGALASNVLTHSVLSASTESQHSTSTIVSAIVAVVLCVQYVGSRTVVKASGSRDAVGLAADAVRAIRTELTKPAAAEGEEVQS